MLTLFRLPKSWTDLLKQDDRTSKEDGTYSKNQLLHGDFNLDPLFITQSRPYEVGLRNRGFVGMQNDLCFLIVNVKATKEENESRKGRVTWDGLEPIIC